MKPTNLDRDQGEKAWDLFAGVKSVLIATHANPDADAVASVLALRLSLLDLVPSLICLTGDGLIPQQLTFLPDSHTLARDLSSLSATPERIVLLDCADPFRLGPLFHQHREWFDGRIPILNIDHHVTNTQFGHINLVDVDAASTTAVLTSWFLLTNKPLTPDMATCLLTGFYGDTLGFQTSSTSASAFELAALLLRAGARHEEIIYYLFRRKALSTIRLWGAALSRVQLVPPVIWTEVTQEMLEQTGATPAEGEGIVNFLSGTNGSVVALLFYEQADGWRVSLRSSHSEVDVAELCRAHGGGGHPRAAGCRLAPGERARQQFLEDLRERVSNLIASRLATR